MDRDTLGTVRMTFVVHFYCFISLCFVHSGNCDHIYLCLSSTFCRCFYNLVNTTSGNESNFVRFIFTDCLWYSGLFEEKLRELSCLHSSAFHLIFDALANPVSLIWMMFEDILMLV